MVIVHISPNAPYNDYWGYQDNLLPKYHKKLGHDVTLIVTNTMHKDGRIVKTDCSDYLLNDGVRVIRREIKKYLHPAITNLSSYMPVYDCLVEIKPDFIFFHGLMSTTIYDAVKYKKKINPDCTIVQDNHLDYNNRPYDGSFGDFVTREYFRRLHRKTRKYISRVYGVTPWRRTYAEDYFAVSPKISDLLIMGADDEKIDFKNREIIRDKIRDLHGIGKDDFLVVAGGKIDKKKHIHHLMKVCGELAGSKLLVFGNVCDSLKEVFDGLLAKYKNIIYIGWLDADKVYDYFFAADLVVFPGEHSVLWEQACACKVPCLFKKWEGMDHVNNGGNSEFIEPYSEKALKYKIKELMFTDRYDQIKQVAASNATDIYLYSNIAKKSLECVKNEA